MGDNKFWLFDWLDTHNARDVTDAQKLLGETRPRKELRERVANVPYETEMLPQSEGPTIVAGCAIDLSGHLDCYAWECMKKQVDNLFSHVWHYFDQVVVVGPSAFEISKYWSDRTESQVMKRLLNYIRLLFYIRQIGAEDMLIFRQKRPACQIHLQQHLEEVGLQSTLARADNIIEKLSRKAEIKTKVFRNHIDYVFIHPEFEHTLWGGPLCANMV